MNWTLLYFGLLVLVIGLAWRAWKRIRRWRAARHGIRRIEVEDALKHLYTFKEEGRLPTLQSMAGRLQVTEDDAASLTLHMQEGGLLRFADGQPQLTEAGREYALHIVRAHRLWERYLADHTGYEETAWHTRAEIAEHTLSRDDANSLASRLGNPLTDPHGDPIPTPDGQLAGSRGIPLTQLSPGQTARIVHLEDEPDSIYAHLVDQGLFPGMHVQVTEKTSDGMRVRRNGHESELSSVAAAAVTVEPVAARAPVPEKTWTLADLRPPARGVVLSISPRCRGAERNRFLDLGIVPGTRISADLSSPAGDPIAYRVRDTLIALRREQANLILIHPPTSPLHALTPSEETPIHGYAH